MIQTQAFRATKSVTRTAAGLLALALAMAPASAMAQEGGTNAPAVVVAPVEMKTLTQAREFTGRVEAIQRVAVRARVQGYVESVEFTEGATVDAGDVLYQIDEGPYEAALARAKAERAAARAALESAEADLKNAEINLQRQQTLLQRDTVSQAVVDDATARRDEAAAGVAQAKAEIARAEANVTAAQLDLGYTTITAAIDGRMGRTGVTAGNLISPESGTMATLVQLDPIRVALALPDRLYTDYVEAAGGARALAESRERFNPTVTLPNGKTYGQSGKIAFVSNEIDPATGTITLYADFANPDAVLLPGAFVVVSVKDTATTATPAIPSSAVLRDRQGPYVFVLSDADTAQSRRVTLGERSGQLVAVEEGLSQGETVIVEGVQKVVPGEKVRPRRPAADTAAASQ